MSLRDLWKSSFAVLHFLLQIDFDSSLHWSYWVTLHLPLVFVLTRLCLLLCHVGGPCVAVYCCWPTDVSDVVFLALLLQTSQSCWGSVWPVEVIILGPVNCPKRGLFPFRHGRTQNDRFICVRLHSAAEDAQSIGAHMCVSKSCRFTHAHAGKHTHAFM